MKSNYWLLLVIFTLIALPGKADEWIRINQLGYLPQSIKVAVFMSEEGTNVDNYSLIDAFTGKTVHTFSTAKATGKMGGMKSTYRLDFSDFNETGTYYLKVGKATSPRFPINTQVYNGTACLTYYLSSMQKEGMKQANIENDKNIYVNGGIVRTNPSKKQLTLVFTAADKADGADAIINTLKKHGIQGGFFFTGEFYELYPDVVKRLLAEGHLVGSHSYGHLLYMPWENRDSLLVTRDEFEQDMLKSYEIMRKAGIEYKDAPIYIPPYEYYNQTIADWAKSMGIQVINYTPGTLSNADYTTPDMGKKYRSSQVIYDKIMEVEKKEGLNGHLMLIHFGTDDCRTDKFYNGYLDKMIKTLKRKGYTFAPVRQAVGI